MLSLPAFWVGILLVYVFAVQMRLLPATGFVPFDVSPEKWFKSLVLPVLTIAITSARLHRPADPRVDGRGARAGAHAHASVRSALPRGGSSTCTRCAAPACRSSPLSPSSSSSCSAARSMIELLFALPGIGQAMQAAVGSADLPFVQALVLVATLVVVIVNVRAGDAQPHPRPETAHIMTVSTTAILTIRRAERSARAGRSCVRPTAVLSLIWLIGLLVASLTSPAVAALRAARAGPHRRAAGPVGRAPPRHRRARSRPALPHRHRRRPDPRDRPHPADRRGRASPCRSRCGPRAAAAARASMNRISEIVMSLPGHRDHPRVHRRRRHEHAARHGAVRRAAVRRALPDPLRPGQERCRSSCSSRPPPSTACARPSASFRHVLPNMSTTVIVQFVLLLRRRHHDAGRPRLHRPRPAAARADLGWHDPDRRALHLPAAVDDGAHRCGPRAHDHRGERARRRPLGRRRHAPAARGDPPQAGEKTTSSGCRVRRRRSRPRRRGIRGSRRADRAVPGRAPLFASCVATRVPTTRTSRRAPPDLDRRTRLPARRRRADGELIVEDLVLGVDGGPALVTGVSLRVRPGRVMGLVGESGCGKSVTSYALLGLLSPGLSVRSGRIQWGASRPRAGRREDAREGARPRDRVHLAGAEPRARPDVHRRLAARRGRSSGCAASARARRRSIAGAAARRRRHRRRAAGAEELPAPDLGRHGAARRDRPRARRLSRSCSSPTSPRRRWTSPSRPRSSACCADSSPTRGMSVILVTPRPRCRRRHLRRRLGHVRRADRRDRHRSATCSCGPSTRTRWRCSPPTRTRSSTSRARRGWRRSPARFRCRVLDDADAGSPSAAGSPGRSA